MAPRLAVVDPLPMFRHGVAMVLSGAGLIVDAPDDILAWAQQVPEGLILLTVAMEPDWQLLTRLQAHVPAHPVIALVEDAITDTGIRAVRAGVRSVVHRSVSGDMLVRAVEATITGHAVVPADVLAGLAGSAGSAGSPPGRANSAVMLAPAKVGWLRELAKGVTVAQLADQVGYSERSMYRLLGALYKELGVTTRTEALVYALERGLLSVGP